MKKFLAVLLLIMVAFTSVQAFADEILFRNLPWDCSPADVKESFGKYLYFRDPMCAPLWSQWAHPGLSSADYSDTHAGFRLETGYPASGITVAGYEIDEARIFFVYGITEDGQLDRSPDAGRLCGAYYSFRFEDVETAYEDLKAKLTNLYGEPEKENDTSIIWYGDNNTAVRMVWSNDKTNDYNYVDIKYGKTDIEAEIPHIMELTAEQERLDAIAEEEKVREENAENNDGL